MADGSSLCDSDPVPIFCTIFGPVSEKSWRYRFGYNIVVFLVEVRLKIVGLLERVGLLKRVGSIEKNSLCRLVTAYFLVLESLHV